MRALRCLHRGETVRTDLRPPAQWVGGIFVGCKKRNDSEEGYIGNARQIRMPEGEMGKFSQDKTSRKNNGLRNRLLLQCISATN